MVIMITSPPYMPIIKPITLSDIPKEFDRFFALDDKKGKKSRCSRKSSGKINDFVAARPGQHEQ